MKTEWLHSKFPSQTEMIGHFYDRHVDDDEEAAKRLDIYLANRSDWQEFKKEIKKGDQLWLFRSEATTWNNGTGKEGYCIVRVINSIELSNSIVQQGEIVKSFLSFGSL